MASNDLPSIAVLDDYQSVALEMADWSRVKARAEVTVFDDHLSNVDELVERLLPFEAICVMRERTPMTAELIGRLPKLKLIASTGKRNAAIDTKAAEARGISVVFTGYESASTIEHTWALILADLRRISEEYTDLRLGGWQRSVGGNLKGKTLAILGLGNIGSEVAKIGNAFGMNVIAWSQNLTAEKAQAAGARLVAKEDLFRQADILTIHVVLSDRSRGLVGAKEIGLMKKTARLVNTSRGPIVDEMALIDALNEDQIAGAVLDVYDTEPLPLEHPFRSMENVLATPHIGYVTQDLYKTFFEDTVANLEKWLDQRG